VDAIKLGRSYGERHPSDTLPHELRPPQDELAALNQGNLMGRVYRVASREAAPVYDLQNIESAVVARVDPGSLIVVFDDPGQMRQVNTARQIFGYMPRSIKLVPVDRMIPAEVYDPKLRAAAEAALPPLSAILQPVEPVVAGGLTRSQILIAVGFGGAVFAGMLILLVVLGK
jgi:hypothetical protein